MKNLVFWVLFLFCCWQANGQDYLQQANACFDKGDYECAKKNYTLFKEFDGSKDVSAQIQMSDKCLRTMNLADDYFKDREYAKARDHYKTVLDTNPKDLNAKKQYDLCMAQLGKEEAHPVPTNDFAIDMVFVQGGTFMMGCTSKQDNNKLNSLASLMVSQIVPNNDCVNNEQPAHQVTVSNYYIGKYEVTQAQWKAIMGNNPSHFNGDNLPVEQVSWDDVQEFIRKLNIQTGKQYRLPTEAEWEYACRGGLQSGHYKYSGSNTAGNVACYNDNSGNGTHPVGSKQANELGIYDMSGNVWEWCQDWYGNYSSNAQTNPQGPSSGSSRVDRGGGWDDIARYCRVSYRYYNTPDIRHIDLGFRIACSSN